MTGDGAKLEARVLEQRAPRLEDKYDELLNKYIDMAGDRNDYRNRTHNAELLLRGVEKLVCAWRQKADAGVPDPTWNTCADDLLTVLLDGL